MDSVLGPWTTPGRELRNLSKEIHEELKSTYGKVFKIFQTKIPRSVKAAESTRVGKSILSYDKNGKEASGAALYMNDNPNAEIVFVD